MQTSLEGAHAWLDRADEHLNALRIAFQDWLYVEVELAMKAVQEGDSAEGGRRPPVSLGTPPQTSIPPLISVLVGEVVQALRRALDYVVYELAASDSGEPQDGTQFPIEHSQAKFRASVGSNRAQLHGLSDGHIAALELYQPYNESPWVSTLQSISNPDKHRHLTVTKRGTNLGLSFLEDHRPEIEVSKTPDGDTVIVPDVNGSSTKVHVSFSLKTEHGLPVCDTLTDIRANVAEVLEAFEPCFIGACPHSGPVPDAS